MCGRENLQPHPALSSNSIMKDLLKSSVDNLNQCEAYKTALMALESGVHTQEDHKVLQGILRSRLQLLNASQTANASGTLGGWTS